MSTQDRLDSNENHTIINLSSFVPGQNYVDNQVMIKFKPNLQPLEIQGFQANLGASVLESTQTLGTQLWTIQGMSVAEAVATYSNHPQIEYIEPNYLYSFDSTIPNDTDFEQLWGLDNTEQTGGTFDADIDAPEAWDISTGNNVVVGVMDSGVDYTHPDLINNMWTNPGEIPGNGIDDDGNGYVDDVHGYDFVFDDPEPDDNVEHGTHVAGTIAAEGNNNLGITGVGWDTQIMALKVGDISGVEAFDAVQGLEYAAMMKQDYGVNINLTNNSWGVEYSQALYDAIAASGEAGQLFVAAAGNSSSDNDLIPQYPASYDLDNIITVAATDHHDQLATFSNYGATSVDLGAPGVDIISTIPGGGYASYDGTSMAAPHVAGVASLIWSQDLTLSPEEVKERILTTVDPIAALEGMTLTGGRLNAYNALLNSNPEVSLGEIHGSKWNDLDGDGEWDENESGLAGWTIYLDQNQNGQLDTDEVSTLTDANGDYSFTNLTAGDYTVAEVLQEGWEQTYPSLSNSSAGTNFNGTALGTFNQTSSLNNNSIIEFAIERESEVNPYFARSQSTTTQWVIGLDPQFSANTLANRLGAQNLGATEYLPNTFIWEFSPNSARTIQKLETFAGVDFLYPLVEQQQQERFVGGDRFLPDDPLFGDQWHLVNTGQTGGTPGTDANVELAWDIAQGTGVVIGIVDDGLEYTHPDLSSQYLPEFSFDFNDDDFDPLPGGLVDNHGTSVAGVAAATGDNGIGVSGSAPSASLAGLRLIAGPANDLDEANALSYMNQDIDIYSNSWGPSDNGATLEGPGPMTLAALQDGVTNGRDGLGSIYVWAAGNGLENDDNVNYDGYANSRYTIAVSAIDHNGIQSDYSEPGAPILVSAYSEGDGVGITTTALLDDGSYTNNFGGTSSAAPLVSGVTALMLEANPNLSWRDIQHILVETAEQNDPLDSDWTTNGAGHDINHKYGFGAIDATAAVNMATTWTSVAPETSTTSDLINVDAAIPDNNLTGITSTITITEDINIESVEVVFDATHTYRGDLEVVLTSPDGTESILAEPHGDGNNNYNSWVFSSVRHWGESSLGDWTLTVSDELSGETGTWNFWQLNIYGTEVNDPQVPGAHTVSLTPGAIVTDINFGNQLIETPLNLSFETGDFTDWTTIGTASIQTAEVGSNPTDGDFHALVTNGVGAVSDADLESFLGLNSGDLDNLGNGDAMEGSAIQLTPITVEAGDIFSFDWNLITNEETPSDYNDFGFVSISSTLLSELADTTNEFVRFGGSFGKETNYGMFDYQFTQAGTYTIGLGVVDADDTSVDSGLLVDNLQVVSDPFFNFGFENSDFTNWNAIGKVTIETSAIGSNPTEGEFQSFITTGQGSMSDTEIESFLGLTPGALDNLGNGDATEGSALEFQPITVEAGDILSFDWNFISNEETPSDYNDFGFVSINSTSLSELADTNSDFFRFTGSFGSQTGYGTFEYQFMESGTVTVGVGVMDAGDTNVDSGLFVDNFQVIPDPMLNANTGFETGDFTDWNTMGQTTIETADFGSTPTEGNYQAFLTTESGAVSAFELEEFLGLNPGALSSLGNGEATEGAALQFQPIIVEAGDVVSFDWNFLTDEATPGSYNDFGFVAINSDSLSELADTNSSFIPFTNSFNQQTGYGTFSYQFQESGTYTIGMGVVDEGDTSGSSGLLIDNFSITSGDDFDSLTPGNQSTTDADPKWHTIQGSLQGELLIGSDQQEDFILADAGDDTVAGGLGNDVIYGEDGDDKIWGNQGDDLLWGGHGNDTLKGGQGVDTFVLAVGEGTDKIRDFQITEDFIGLSGELTFEQLSITQHGKNTWIDVNDETLAILTGMNASTLTADVFTVV